VLVPMVLCEEVKVSKKKHVMTESLPSLLASFVFSKKRMGRSSGASLDDFGVKKTLFIFGKNPRDRVLYLNYSLEAR
jgi:hypothetical protein